MPILDYIRDTWRKLNRTHRDLAAMAIDPKFHPSANGRWPIYVPSHEDLDRVQERLGKVVRFSKRISDSGD